ncbi:benenodin family lasso peptide [Altererythrobacter sp. Root672]|nr:benenodin family lasso peptide [Altererythrobacter sp. Root672]
MEREHTDSGLVELGTASTETRGQQILATPESNGYLRVGPLVD